METSTPLTLSSLTKDDTGSSLLSLNEPDDLLMLGLNPGDYLPLQVIEVDTANGRVYRQMTAVEINFKDDRGAYMGDWKTSPCLLNPPDLLNPDMQTRLSGMHIRNNHYTATAPDGTGRLYISTKKNGVTARLPTV